MPKASLMGVDALTGVGFQRNYLWDVILPPVAAESGGIFGVNLGKLVQEVAFGDYSIDQPSIMRVGPFTANFTGLLNVQTIKMTFIKSNPDTVAPYLYAWKKLMIDGQGLFLPKDSYQKNIYIRFFDMAGNVTEQYKCIGCWPSTFPQYNLDYSSNKLTTITPVFTVDKIEYTRNFND